MAAGAGAPAGADSVDPGRYSRHLDLLIALTTHLALTTSQYKSRTPTNLAGELGLGKQEVKVVLDAFPGLFRKSATASKGTSENFYSLRARRALQPDSSNDDAPLPELRVEVLKALLDFVSQRADAEISEEQFHKSLNQAKRSSMIAAAAAVVAAIASIVAALAGH